MRSSTKELLKEIMIVVLVVFGISGIVLNFEEGQAEAEQNQYCELVQLWEGSDGENGHPDYKRVAAEWCINNHTIPLTGKAAQTQF